MKPFMFRGHLDVRCQWQAHELSHESDSGRVERLLARLAFETPPLDIPIKEIPPGAKVDLPKGVELNVNVDREDLVELIEKKREEWGYRYASTSFRRLLIQACSLSPEVDVSPEEGLSSFNVGEAIEVEDWIEVFHSVEAAAHAAGYLAERDRIKIVYGGTKLYLPRGFTGRQNPVKQIIRMPDNFLPSGDDRKVLSYLCNGHNLPAFAATDLSSILFRDSDRRDQLRTVIDRQGAIVLQYQEIPIGILVSEEFFLHTHPRFAGEITYLPLEGLGIQELIELFMKTIVPSVRDKEAEAYLMEIPGLGRAMLVRLGLFNFNAFS
jgi:hypothetical protein